MWHFCDGFCGNGGDSEGGCSSREGEVFQGDDRLESSEAVNGGEDSSEGECESDIQDWCREGEEVCFFCDDEEGRGEPESEGEAAIGANPVLGDSRGDREREGGDSDRSEPDDDIHEEPSADEGYQYAEDEDSDSEEAGEVWDEVEGIISGEEVSDNFLG